MLIVDDGTSWLAITQPAHAWLSGQIARAWGNAAFARPDPFEGVCLGVEQHDVAWTAWDLRPPLHPPARRAASFYEAPAGPRLDIWRAAPEGALALSPWAALLVSLHGRNIHTRFVNRATLPRDDGAVLDAYLEEQRDVQDRLIDRLGTTREVAERAGELVFCLDGISLSICHGWPARDIGPVDGTTIRLAPAEGDAFTLDPWPLATDRLVVELDARRFTERFDDEAALHAALDAAPFERLRWTLRRA